MTQTKQHVTLIKKKSGVAFILLDCPGRSNVLNAQVLSELEAAYLHVAGDADVKATVVMSGKKDTFVSGADLAEVRRLPDQDAAYRMCRDGQKLLDRGKHLAKPLVIAVNGACLGGGVELILSAHKRLATREAITMFAMPEVRLGIIPGIGGTQRLARLLGVKAALELILTSDPIDADKALEIGLIDEIVPTNDLMVRAEEAALELLTPGNPETLASLVEKTEGLPADYDEAKLKQLFAITERSLRIKTKGHYPAPIKAVEVMKAGLQEGIEKGLELEARTFAELCMSEVCNNLMSVFIAAEFYKLSALAATKRGGAKAVETVGVVGTGTMGSAIAGFAASNGYSVVLKGRDKSRVAETVEKIKNSMTRLDSRGNDQDKIESCEIAAATETSQLAKCDLIVEASIEKIEVKQEIFQDLLSVVSNQTVLASKYSSLSVSSILPPGKPANRIIGLHFFQPVERMQLVEIVSHSQSDRDAISTASAFVASLGKIPLLVKDGSGFLVNRILSCYLEEAARLCAEKVPVSWIEESALAFGMPIGPMELIDEIGWELIVAIAKGLHKGLGDRMRPPDIMFEAFASGLRGKKAGPGVFMWDPSGKRKGVNPILEPELGVITSSEKVDKDKAEEIAQRLVLPMIDEAARCLEEKIVLRAREVDVAMVFGIGFPPFRGGLLRYADKLGIPYVRKQLESIYKTQTPKRKVSELLKKLESEGRGFYGRGSGDEG